MIKSFNILYVGPLHASGCSDSYQSRAKRTTTKFIGSTCFHRMQALKELGYDVVPIDTAPEDVRNRQRRFSYRVRRKLFGPLDLANANRKILAVCQQKEFDIVWIDKGITIKPETLLEIKEMYPKVKLVHYNPDDPFGRHGKSRYWKTFSKAIPEYNVHFVPRKVNVNEYKKLGAQMVIQSIPFWGYCPETHKPMQLSEGDKKQMGGQVGFIGSWEYERAHSLFFLAKNEFQVRVWGDGWKKCKIKHPNLRIEYKSIWGLNYARAICAFDINLCFLRKANRDLQTTKSIEIPSCGGFMLAERTTEHLKLFEEGKEAVFFSSDEELLEKVKYYLLHPQERQRVAEAGRQRCLKSGYSNRECLRGMLRIVCVSKEKRCLIVTK